MHELDIDESLFAHIHNDAFLTGSFGLEGNQFKYTVGYLSTYMASLSPNAVPASVQHLLQACRDMVAIERSMETADAEKNQDKLRACSREIYQKIAALDVGEYLLMPGGWRGEQSGHAIVYCFRRVSSGDIILSVHNSGAGLHYHAKRSEADRELYCPTKEYSIPLEGLNKTDDFIDFLHGLLELQTPQLRSAGVINEAVLYGQALAKISFIDGQELPAPLDMDAYCYTGGQLSGTCSQRSIHQMLKGRFSSLEEYRRFIYGFKSFALDNYMTKLKNDQRLGKLGFFDLKQHGQIEKAIRHNLRLLLLKSTINGEYLFDTEQRNTDKQRFEGYFRELKKARATVRQTAAEAISRDEYPLASITGEALRPYHFEGETIKLGAVQVAKPQPSLQGGYGLIRELRAVLEACKKWEGSGNFHQINQRLEQLFLTMPIPEQRSAELHPFYREIIGGSEKEGLAILQALQEKYRTSCDKIVGEGSFLPQMYLVSASIFTIGGHLAEHSTILKENFFTVVWTTIGGMISHNDVTHVLAFKDPTQVARYRALKALYADCYQVDIMGAEAHYKCDAVVGYYKRIIQSFPELEQRLIQSFEQKYGDSSSEEIAAVRKQKLQALYVFLNHDEVRTHPTFDRLHRIFSHQEALEQFLYFGTNIDTWQRSQAGVPPEPIVLHWSTWSKSLNVRSQACSSDRSFYIPRRALPSDRIRNEGVVWSHLAYYMNYGSSNAQFWSSEPSFRSDNTTQLEPVGTLSIQDREKRQAWLSNQVVTNKSLEERELFHLTSSSKHQIIMSLEYFSQHPEKLADADMREFFKGTLLAQGLLAENLHKETFWQALDTFLLNGLEHTERKGALRPNSCFFIEMVAMVHDYAYRIDSTQHQKAMDDYCARMSDWIQNSHEPGTRAALQRCNFMLRTALLSKAVSQENLVEALRAYLFFSNNPRIGDTPSIVESFEEERAQSLFVGMLVDTLQNMEVHTLQALLQETGLLPKGSYTMDCDFSGTKAVIEAVHKSSGSIYLFDLSSATVYRDGLGIISTPLRLRQHPVMRALGEDFLQCTHDLKDKTRYKIPSRKGDIYATMADGEYTFSQMLPSPSGEDARYYLCALGGEQAERYNIVQQMELSGLPDVLYGNDYMLWVNPQDNTAYLCDKDNQPQYQLSGKRQDHYYNSLVWTIEDVKTGAKLMPLDDEASTPLEGLEDARFVLSLAQGGHTLYQLPRYGLSFQQNHDTENCVFSWNGRSYTVDKKAHLDARMSGLSCEDGTICILPIAQFINQSRRESEGEYYHLSQDISDIVAQDMVHREPKFEAPLLWSHNHSRQHYVLKMKNGEPIPENGEQALYLCYLYLGSNQPEKAWAILDYCSANLGGLMGTAEEVRLLRWICTALPFERKAKSNANKQDAKAVISNPSMVACQLKALAQFTQAAKDPRAIVFPKTTAETASPEAYIAHQDISADRAFVSSTIVSKLHTLYNNYQLMTRDRAAGFHLSDNESRNLLNFYHDRLPETKGKRKACGALGAEWLRLNTINLKTELNGLQEKAKRCPLSAYEQRRAEAIQTYIKEHEGVSRKQSKLEYVSIPLSLDKADTIDLDCGAVCKFEEVSPNGSETWYRVIHRQEDSMNALSSRIEEETFFRNLPSLISIALDTQHPRREELRRFCRNYLIATCHQALEHQATRIPFAVNLLYRSFNLAASDRSYYLKRGFDFFSSFYYEVRDCAADEIIIPQMKDDISELLLSAQAVWDTLPERPEAEAPRIDASSIHALSLFAPNDFPSFAQYAKDWCSQQAKFRDMLEYRSSDSESDLSDSEAVVVHIVDDIAVGHKKLQVLNDLKDMAETIYRSSAFREALTEQTDARIEALSIQLENLEHTLLQRASRGPRDDVKRQVWQHELASAKRVPLTMQRLLALYFENDIYLYQKETGLDKEQIAQLHAQLAMFIKLSSFHQQLQRVRTGISNVRTSVGREDRRDATYQLMQTLFTENLVDVVKEPAMAVFQYYEGILLRPVQKEAIGRLLEKTEDEGYQEVVEKIIMGGGKSKVILPIMAFKKATGENLVMLEVPRALLHTNYRDLQSVSRNLFGQGAELFEFNRDTDCSSKALEKLHRRLCDAMVNKRYLVTTGESVQSLQLKLLEILENPPKGIDGEPPKPKVLKEWHAQVRWANQLVSMVKHRGDLLIDEAHQGLLLKNKLNYSIGEAERIPRFVLEATVDLYQCFAKVSLKRVPGLERLGLTLQDVLQTHKPFKEKEQYLQACDILADYLVSDLESPLRKRLMRLGYAINSESMQKRLKAYLLDEGEEIPQMVLSLPQEMKEVFALYKEQVSHLLPYTLRRNFSEHYGPSKDRSKDPATRAMAIPYVANNVPNERSAFGNCLESINYTIQSMMITGVSDDLLKQYLSYLFQEAVNETREKNGGNRNACKVDDTVAAKLYALLTTSRTYPNGRLLSDVDTESDDFMQALQKELGKRPDLIQEVLKAQVLKSIPNNGEVLQSNAYSHLQVRSVQALTGTPWNASTFHQRLTFDSVAAKGSDGYIISSMEQKKTPLVAIDYRDQAHLVQHLLMSYKASDEMRAIIDVCAGFKGVSNLSVAEQIAHYIETHPRQFEAPDPIQYVLFFNDDNQLCARSVGKPEPEIITLDSSNEAFIAERLSCGPGARFTYYDQAHTVGTDIKQVGSARAAVLCDEETMISPFMQGATRMRGLVEGKQHVDVYVPPKMAELGFKKVTRAMRKREKLRLQTDNFEAARLKLEDVVRSDCLERVLAEPEPEKKAALYRAYRSYFIEHQSLDLFVQYGGVSQEVSTRRLLEQLQETLLEDWASLMEATDQESTKRPSLEAAMQVIVAQTCEEGVCAHTQMSRATPQAAEVEVQKEVEIQIEKEEYNETFGQSRVAATYRDWGSCYGGLNYKTLREICNSGTSVEAPEFSDTIRASQNYYKTYEGQEKYMGMFLKPVHALLFDYDDHGQLRCTILSQQELEELSTNPRCRPENSWISTTQHHCLEGTMPDMIQRDETYQSIIEQVRFFSGEFGLMLRSKVPLRWLKDNPKEKMDYFKQHLSLCREYNEAYFSGVQATLLGKSKMFACFLQHPQIDYRDLDWRSKFANCDDNDCETMENAAQAFYEVLSHWWWSKEEVNAIAEKYQLSSIGMAYLMQYHKTLQESDTLLKVGGIIAHYDEQFENLAMKPDTKLLEQSSLDLLLQNQELDIDAFMRPEQIREDREWLQSSLKQSSFMDYLQTQAIAIPLHPALLLKLYFVLNVRLNADELDCIMKTSAECPALIEAIAVHQAALSSEQLHVIIGAVEMDKIWASMVDYEAFSQEHCLPLMQSMKKQEAKSSALQHILLTFPPKDAAELTSLLDGIVLQDAHYAALDDLVLEDIDEALWNLLVQPEISTAMLDTLSKQPRFDDLEEEELCRLAKCKHCSEAMIAHLLAHASAGDKLFSLLYHVHGESLQSTQKHYLLAHSNDGVVICGLVEELALSEDEIAAVLEKADALDINDDIGDILENKGIANTFGSVLRAYDKNPELVLRLCQRYAETANGQEIEAIIEVASNSQRLPLFVESLVLNPACNAEHYRRLIAAPHPRYSDPVQQHFYYWQKLQSFDRQVQRLDGIVQQLAEQLEEGHDALDSACALAKELRKHYDTLSKNRSTLYDPKVLDGFAQTCRNLIACNREPMQQHQGLWFTLSPIIRNILGILAALTVLPAVVVGLSSKHGYVDTFFALPKTDIHKSLDEVDSALEDIPRLDSSQGG